MHLFYFVVGPAQLCYPIHHSYCSNIPWHSAFLPNYRNHTTMVSAPYVDRIISIELPWIVILLSTIEVEINHAK